MPFTTHPAIENLDDEMQIIRFMKLDKFLGILTSGSLYFARGSELGDEYEGKFPKRMMENIRDSNEDPSIYNMWEQLRKNAQLTTYINCWFLNKKDHGHMWKKYAGPSGVAIVSSLGRLRNEINQTASNVYIGSIKYGDNHLLSKSIIGNELEYWLWKRKKYKKESELRCIIQPPYFGGQSGVIIKKVNNSPKAVGWTEIDNLETPKGINVNVNLNNLIEKIVLSPSSEIWMIPVIEKLISKFGLICEVEKPDGL